MHRHPCYSNCCQPQTLFKVILVSLGALAVEARQTAVSLLNFGMIFAGYGQPWAVNGGSDLATNRPWTLGGDAFGIMSWTTANNAYKLFYKDDDARCCCLLDSRAISCMRACCIPLRNLAGPSTCVALLQCERTSTTCDLLG